MQERDSLAFGATARGLINEGDAGGAAALQHCVEVVNGHAEVVDSGPAAGDEFRDGGVGGGWLEQFHERVAGHEPGDACSVGIAERRVVKAEYVAEERLQGIQRLDGEADVGDAGAAAGLGGHGGLGRVTGGAARGASPHEHYHGAPGLRSCPGDASGGGVEMSNAVAVTDADFEAQVEKHAGLTVVDFWATWCGPCRMIAPILDQLAVEYDGKVRVAKLDVDSNQKTAMRFNVRSIPTMLFFKDGKLVDQVVGAVPKAALAAKFEQHAA